MEGDNSGKSKGVSTVSCLIEIALIVLARFTIAKDPYVITEPLRKLPPITNTTLYQIPENNYIAKAKTGFLQRKDFSDINSECTDDKRAIYEKYVGDKIDNIIETLQYNKKMSTAILIINAVSIGAALFFGFIMACVCITCLESMKESGQACCLMIDILLLILISLGFAVGVLVCSVLAMNKIKNDLPLIPRECAPDYAGVINEFNSYRDGFNSRNIAMVVLSSIIMGFYGLFFLCIFCACCCGAIHS